MDQVVRATGRLDPAPGAVRNTRTTVADCADRCRTHSRLANLHGQATTPPRTYTYTVLGLPLGGPDITVKVYRDGDREVIEKSYPVSADRPKGYRDRTLYDFQAHKLYIWLPDDASVPCPGQALNDQTGPVMVDVITGFGELTGQIAALKPKAVGNETVKWYCDQGGRGVRRNRTDDDESLVGVKRRLPDQDRDHAEGEGASNDHGSEGPPLRETGRLGDDVAAALQCRGCRGARRLECRRRNTQDHRREGAGVDGSVHRFVRAGTHTVGGQHHRG